MIRWNWSPEGVEIQNGKEPKSFKFLPVTIQEIEEYLTRVDRVREIYSILLAAKKSFASGQAEYDDATTRLNGLLEEFGRAEYASLEVSREVSVFFDPPAIDEAFKGHEGELIRFVTEAVAKLTPKKE